MNFLVLQAVPSDLPPAWVIFAGLAVVCFIVYLLVARNPGNVQTPDDLKRLNKNPQFHLEDKTKQIERQTQFFQAQTRKVAAIDEMENSSTRLHERETLTRATHEVAVNTANNQNIVLREASTVKLDPASYAVNKLNDETHRRKLEEQAAAQRLAIEQANAIEDRRLQGYAQEVHIDVQAALGMHLTEIEQVDYIGQKIQRLRGEKADQSRIDFLENLREQMARRILQAPEQSQLGGADGAAKSETGD